MVIPNEALEVSLDALEDVVEVGAKFLLKTIKKNQNPRPVYNPDSLDKLDNIYSAMYGQNKRQDNPDVESVYELHGVATYDPTTNQLKGSGLVENCRMSMLTIVYEYVKVGYVTENDSYHDFMSKLRKNTIVEFNGMKYFVKEVAIVAVYEGFGIVCNLGCDVYG